jgi:hypothetical protein
MKSRFLLIVFSFIIFYSHAQWQSLGPYGGDVNCLKARDTVLYAGTDNGVFELNKNSKTWKKCGTGLENKKVRCICITENSVIAGTDNGCFMLNPETNQWIFNTDMGSGYVLDLASKDNIVIAGTHYGLKRSDDNGKSWIKVSSIDQNLVISGTKIIGKLFFAGTGGDGMYLSKDNGETWLYSNPAYSVDDYYNGYGKYYYDCSMLENKLYVATENGMYVSNDTGSTWTSTGGGHHINDLMSCDGRLYSCTDGGLYVLDTIGSSWKYADLLNGKYYQQVYSAEAFDSKIYAATGLGIFVSPDEGISWNGFNQGMATIDAFKIVANDSVVAALSYNSLFISTDQGETWKDITSNLDDNRIVMIAMYGHNIYAATTTTHFTGIYQSSDEGKTWQLFHTEDTYTNEVHFAFQDSLMYLNLSSMYNHRFVSHDGGMTWSEWPGMQKYGLGTFSVGSDEIFSYTYNEIYHSYDMGVTWDSINDGLKRILVSHERSRVMKHTFIAGCGSVIFLGNEDEYPYRYEPKSKSWQYMEGIMPEDQIKAILCEGKNLFCCFKENGVYFSDNECKEWTPLPSEFGKSEFKDMAANKNYLFLSVKDGGIWRYPIKDPMKK